MLSLDDLLKLGKPGPGRPRGKGKNDTALLARVGDLLLRHPSMKPYTAIYRVVPPNRSHQRDTVARRLKRAWDEQRKTLLAEAKQRRDAKMRRADLDYANELEAALGGASIAAAIGAAQVTSIALAERDIVGAATYDLIRQANSVTNELARRGEYATVTDAGHRHALEALGYMTPMRATDFLYGSPRRPRYATDMIYEKSILDIIRETEEAALRAAGLWVR